MKSLVELHGGSVMAASPGFGTTFTVQIPVAILRQDDSSREHPSALAFPMSDRTPNSDLSGINVLVIDDDEDALEPVRRLLTECGATVQTTTSGADALAPVPATNPHVVLCDLGMPEMDGYELMRR